MVLNFIVPYLRRKTFPLISFLLLLLVKLEAQAQTGVSINTTGSTTVDASALLDLNNQQNSNKNSKGLLLPRVASLSDVTTPSATGLVVYQTGSPSGIYYYTGSSWILLGSGNGTVTSVGLTVPSGFSVSGSPVTGSGTLGITTTLSGLLYGTGSGFAAATINAPLTYGGGSLGITQAGAITNGYLSSVDWNTFNSKISGNQTITLSGDVTGSGATSITTTLSASGVTAGNYGNNTGTSYTYLSVDAKGRITAAATQSIAFPVTSVNASTGAVSLGLSNLNDATITAPANNQLLQYNGSKWVNVTPAFQSALNGNGYVKQAGAVTSYVPQLSLTTDVSGLLPIANGGTNIGTLGAAGSVIYSNGSQHASTAAGTTGQVLTSNGSGAPTWTTPSSGGVTSFSSGNLSPLFTTTVTNAATTPALSFTLNTAPANTFFAGPVSGAAAAPTFRTLSAADLPSGNNNYIQNQLATSQSANFWVSGPVNIGTSSFNNVNQLNVATINAASSAVVGTNTATSGSGSGDGVDGFTAQRKAAGVYGFNSNNLGTGIIAAGNNTSTYYLVAGSGGAFTGESVGLFSNYTTTGTGQAIYTEDNTGSQKVRINYWNGSVQYKIFGDGTVSTVAEGIGNTSQVVLHAPEAPEILFEDYGEGTLVNGKAHVNIDPVFSKNIAVNERHPLRVFIQPEGECNGVYVTHKSLTGFDVTELQNGNSNTTFQWHIVANRSNEVLANGKVSRNEDMRFEPAPADKSNVSIQAVSKKAFK